MELQDSFNKVAQLDAAVKESDRQCKCDIISGLDDVPRSDNTGRKSRTNEGNLKRDLADQARAYNTMKEEHYQIREEVRQLRDALASERKSMEERLTQERVAKEAARAQLERRIDSTAAQKSGSKFKVRVLCWKRWKLGRLGGMLMLSSVFEWVEGFAWL
jgi:small-conductance mechanosensitive channel